MGRAISCPGGVEGILARDGGLAEVGDVFGLVLIGFLSAAVALAFIVFLSEALCFGTAGGVFSVSLISPSSRLSSASKAIVLLGGAEACSTAEEAAVVGAEDSSSP
jgi:hypothetical protein